MSTNKSTWKAFERQIAADFAEATGLPSRRNPLSGANNCRDDGSARPGDILIPPNLDVLVEAKYRATNAQHALYREAAADAVTNKIDPEHTVLATKAKGERGYLVTIGKELFWQLISLPGAISLLSK